MTGPRKDLLLVVPDADMDICLKTLLSSRHASLGIPPISFYVARHPFRDPGVRSQGVEFARTFLNQYRKCLLMLDYEGSGATESTGGELRRVLLSRLQESGWGDRGEVVVLEPEFEIWVWQDSPHVARALGWPNWKRLRGWLRKKEFWDESVRKPPRPKEAMHAALQETRTSLSASIFGQIARTVNLQRCQDQQFELLVRILRSWFPQ